MRYLFLVQGEGRGHMSQAIALYTLLRDHGHETMAVLVGRSRRRRIPGYFYSAFPVFTGEYSSPNFIAAKNRKGINLLKSFLYNGLKAPLYIRSVFRIRKIVRERKPDVIVNFYDMIGGLYAIFFRDIKMVCIAHHFFYHHPDAVFPPGRKMEKWLLFAHNAIASWGSDRKLALSFRQATNPGKNIYIVPPLLRKEITGFAAEEAENGHILCGYLLNEGFAAEIQQWHTGRPDIACHIFWDRKDAPKKISLSPNLTFYQVDDRLFISSLKICGMFATTAGFESLCEAMLLGKPFMCVPSAGHYEQSCNAIDACLEGAGIYDFRFNLDRLIKFRNAYNFNVEKFRRWALTAEQAFIEHLTF